MEQLTEYVDKFLSGATPVWGFFIAACSYILFPDQVFFTGACAVVGAIILDIITKYVALSKQAGGYWKAVQTKLISSNKLWEGTIVKIYAYLVVAILVGLCYRVVQLEQLGMFSGSVIYTIMFLREAQSCFENLCDTGADLKWLVFWTRKKQDQILRRDGVELNKEDDDNAKTI
jgi:hypothetical protein